MEPTRLQTILTRARRVFRRVLVVLAWIVAAVVLAVVLVLSLAPARRALLDRGLVQVDAMLDGDLVVGHADWPRLGRLELHDVDWSDGDLAIAHVDTLVLDIALRRLFDRHVQVDEVLVAGVRADIAAIQSHLPAAPPDTTAVAVSDTTGVGLAPVPVLQQGALPPLPSATLAALTVRRVQIATAPEQTVWLDDLAGRVDLAAGADASLAARVRARPLPDLAVAWQFDGTIAADSLRFALAPLVIDHPDSQTASSPASPGRIRAPRDLLDDALAGRIGWPHLRLEGLAVRGDLGRWELDAQLAGRQPGQLTLRSSIPRPPRMLITTLAAAGVDTLAPGLLDTVVTRWSQKDAPGLDLTIDVTPPAADAELWRGRVTASGSLVLPAPGSLAPLLPAPLRIDAWGPVIADIDVDVDARQGMPTARLRLDLGRSDWLDRAVLAGRADTNRVQLDTLDVARPGLALHAQGRADRDSVALTLALELPDAALAEVWDDPALDDLDLAVTAALTAAGPWPLPRAELDVTASATSPLVTLPQLDLRALAAPDTVSLALRLPAGLSARSTTVQSLETRFDGAVSDSLRRVRGALTLRGAMDPATLALVSRIDVNHLTTAPAGSVTVDTLAITLDEHDIASDQPWSIAFSLADTSAAVSGLKLTGALGQLNLDAMATIDSLAADLGLDLRLDLEPLRLLITDPVVASLVPEATLLIGGRLQAAGEPLLPWATGDVRVGFAGVDELARISAVTHLSVRGRGDAPRDLDVLTDPGGRPRAALDLALLSADTNLVRVRVDAPLPDGSADTDSLGIVLLADGSDLSHLSPLLPDGISLAGRFSADTRISGPFAHDSTIPELDLGGGLELTDMRLGLPDGSWVAMQGNVDLEGTSLEPVVRGGLHIDAGLLRIPEPPPSLLPTGGDALLWDEARFDSLAIAVDDSLAAAADTTASAQLAQTILPDLTFNITCPGRLWLRGQGLDVELAGDLVLRLKGGKPTIEGELEAEQGTMRQLGHVFRLERGRIVFYADESTLDPELDLQLGVRVNDYQVRIIIAGTATEPTLDFESDPDLPVGDIMSVLLFGRTADELDEGQTDLLADRAGQIAAAYGSVALTESVAKEVGLDVLTIAPRDDDDQTTALTVGKYLNPQVLVRYEQLLDEESAFFVHLDYSFWKDLELHTQVSQGQESGAEIKWEHDW
jgi:hypothetical protein